MGTEFFTPKTRRDTRETTMVDDLGPVDRTARPEVHENAA